jgi:hypothetical protein
MWIPCDARTGTSGNQCLPNKAGCLAQTGPGGRSCEWVRTDRADSVGWKTALYGSPCVPSSLLSDPIKMNMYTQVSPAPYRVDLQLGERGVILSVFIQQFAMNAADCFAKRGAASWVGGQMPAGATSSAAADGTSVQWSLFDSKAKVYTRFQCVRALVGGQMGAPRINVQEVTAAAQAKGSGFCESGSIDDKSGSTRASNSVHTACTLSAPSPLNACKNLVSQSMTEAEASKCAQMYCAMSAAGQAKCRAAIGGGSSDAGWLTAYCISAQAANAKLSLSTCKKNVQAQGYPWAVATYGNGQKSAAIGERECGTSLQQYLYKNKASCEDGVTLEIQNADGSWSPYLWFPAASPPCNGKLVITGTEPNAEPLFSHPLRMKQCDVRADPVCANVSPCSTTYGAEFKLAFNSLQRMLTEIYNKGQLLCVPAGSPPSSTWCLPGAPDYAPQKYCPCPANAGRRLLLAQSALDTDE